jgi:hypothetical protein
LNPFTPIPPNLDAHYILTRGRIKHKQAGISGRLFGPVDIRPAVS